MSSRPPRAPASAPPPAPPALSAFLRGVERRGAVLAELQAGDALEGDAALAAAMRAFRAGAAAQPMAEWPERFWTLLLASPVLRRGGAEGDGRWPQELAALGRIPPGPRAALLLRLAAGLEAGPAADVLGVAPASYGLALRRALPHLPDGRADATAWAALRNQVHRRIKTLPAERLAHLAHLREVALSAHPEHLQHRPAARPRGWLRVLWALFALCVLAMAATWLWPAWLARSGAGDIRQSELADQRAAARFDPPFAAVTHRDFELLADPDGLASAESLAFHSWLAAQPEVVAAARDAAEASNERDDTQDPPPAGRDATATGRGETVDAPR
jgi:hypothetical protein